MRAPRKFRFHTHTRETIIDRAWYQPAAAVFEYKRQNTTLGEKDTRSARLRTLNKKQQRAIPWLAWRQRAHKRRPSVCRCFGFDTRC